MSRGFTLVELIVTVAVVSIIAVSILAILQTGLFIVGDDKARNGALALAEDMLELVKNLPYDQVGTVNGVPAGALLQSETRTANNIPYTLTTEIRYIDDVLDGIAPLDTAPQDYKRVRVEASWNSRLSGKGSAVLVTDVSPPGLETNVPGGTLLINVADGSNAHVPQTTITINAPTANPPVAIVTTTDDAGTLILPGVPVCSTNCYHITATKNGYSQDTTTSPQVVAQPARADLSVANGSVLTTNFTIDQTGTLAVTARHDSPSNPIANLALTVQGSKTIGQDAQNQPVLKFTGTYTTATNGRFTIPALEPDSYQIFLPTNSGYDIAETDPLLPVPLAANGSSTATLVLADHTTRSLRVAVTDQSNAPLSNTTITLTAAGGQATLKTNGTTGQVFYSNLASGAHTLKIEKSNFESQTIELDITDNQYVHITLAPSP